MGIVEYVCSPTLEEWSLGVGEGAQVELWLLGEFKVSTAQNLWEILSQHRRRKKKREILKSVLFFWVEREGSRKWGNQKEGEGKN